MFNKKDSVKLELNYRGFDRIEGSDFLVCPLSNQEKAFKGIKFVTFNYLFLNIQDFSTHWLFPTNNQIINTLYQIPLENSQNIGKNQYHEKHPPFYDGNLYSEEIIQTGWLLFVFTKTEMSQDRKIIALSDVSGGNLVEIINDVDFIYDKVRVNKDSLILMYHSSEKNLVSEIKLSEKRILKTKELPKVNE
ncbi:hypothetical protein BH10ACI1_BH10ACI1_11270 [soil metagenome]